MNEREVAVRLQHVSKYYKLYKDPRDRLKEALHPRGRSYHRRFYALRDIDLTLHKGEVLGIVGCNGSGKSTLLKTICGVLTPSDGEVQVKGSISALLELGAGFNPEFTGYRNIYFYAAVLGLSREEIEEKLDDILAFADLGEFIHQPLKTYSSGMKARLGFSVAVHVDPEILILDEVLAVGDVLFRRRCYDRMQAFFESGKTIIYTSHDANSINELCSRAILLHQGRILMEGEPKQVTANYRKLLFSSDANKTAVLDEIRSGKSAVVRRESMNHIATSDTEEESRFHPGEAFLPDFRSEPQWTLSNAAVQMKGFRIVNEYGAQVNMLVPDRRYTFIFDMIFPENFTSLSCGAQVSTIKGMMLSVAALWHGGEEHLLSVRAGDQYSVFWDFHCRLLEGTYFFSTSCSAIINDERMVLARVDDALVFKVAAEAGSVRRGLVALNDRIRVECLPNGDAREDE